VAARRRDRFRVGAATTGARLVSRGRNERLDRARELAGISVDQFQHLAVLARLTLARERELCLREQTRKRRAELVRQLGGEAAFPAEARGQPVEERVEGGGELGQLVVRRAEREAVVELPFAPGSGLSGHSNHLPERGGQQPARGNTDEQQHDCAENE
jgi:hypothetical protein